MSSGVTYSATLDIRRETVLFLSSLLYAERRRRGTRNGRRALGCFAQAVLVLRWFIDSPRVAELATDHAVSVRTVYRYLHEGIDVLAAHAPDLCQALTAAKDAGLGHVNLDGVVIPCGRSTGHPKPAHLPAPAAPP